MKQTHITEVEDFSVEVGEGRHIFRTILNGTFKSGGKSHFSVYKMVHDGQLYSKGELDKLSAELKQENLCAIINGNIIRFFIKHSKLSNPYPSVLKQDCLEFKFAEQYLIFRKANLFEDEATTVMNTSNPVHA